MSKWLGLRSCIYSRQHTVGVSVMDVLDAEEALDGTLSAVHALDVDDLILEVAAVGRAVDQQADVTCLAQTGQQCLLRLVVQDKSNCETDLSNGCD